MQNDILKKNIMRRVYMVYILRMVVKPLILEGILLVCLMGVATFFISLPHVITNLLALHGIQALGKFFVAAFMNTQSIVKAISISVVLVTIAFAYDFIRRIGKVTAYKF